jgi:mercuric ion transport protein
VTSSPEVSAVNKRPAGWLQYLSLFTSVGTLLCCALPSILVLLGLGATVASTLSAAPVLVLLSHHKLWVFSIAGALIFSNFVYMYALSPRLRVSVDACNPGDPACSIVSGFSRAVLWLSVAIYCVGFFTAFLLGPLLLWWDSKH